MDLHTHSDSQVVDPLLRASTNYVTQGCTTQVTGNCGSGPVDASKLYAAVEKDGAGTNVAHLIPQGGLRSRVIGDVDRPATTAELQQMCELADHAMRDGAWGMSTGLIYVPSVYAGTDEISAIAKVVASHGGFYASHIRGEGGELLTAITEALAIGTASGAPVHISHFKSSGEENWGKLRLAIDLIEQARSRGSRVTADQYPYTASSTSLEATIVPTWARSGGEQQMQTRLADPETGPRIRAEIEESLKKKRDGAALFIARYSKKSAWVGQNLAEIAKTEQRTATDVAWEILRNGGAAIVNFSMDEEDVRLAMQRPWVATASDGRSYLPGADRPHPRSYGTFPRKIGRYSLTDKVLPVEVAVRSSSGLPADILGLPERGYLRAGYFADVVVFDPATFLDAATFDNPHQYAVGVKYAFVNGQPAVHSGVPTGTLAGRALRHKTPQPQSTVNGNNQP
ncbi:MAG: N-acyl-D-amino acid deacylase [Planctomycetales bacterium 12-60-4]|nr:MAG: N-acyl-D-amino acid deacylase [Planctomycetales bacterium 12-60-4]